MKEKIRNIILVALLLIWIALNINLIFKVQLQAIRYFFQIFSLDLEARYKVVDGDFLNFVKLCQEKIPLEAEVEMINITENFQKLSSEWARSEFFQQRLSYYLYPRKLIIIPSLASSNKNRYRIIYQVSPALTSLRLFEPKEEIK